MTREERRALYMQMYQAIGAAWNELPDVGDVWRDHDDVSRDDASLEWNLYNALDHGLHAVMDTLAALVDVTEDTRE